MTISLARPHSNSEEDLRRRAETLLSSSEPMDEYSAATMRELAHDLHVHQIELRMQNEELLETQGTLAEAAANYRDLYDFAPVGYLTLTREGLIEQANLTAAALLGQERQQIKGKRLADFIDPQDQDIYFLHHRGAVASGMREHCELRLQKEQGGLKYVQLESACCDLSASELPRLRVTLTDVTERARANAELKELHRLAEAANHAKSEFLANMSHEIRTPLNAVIGLSTILSRSIDRADRNHVFLETLKDSANSLLELVNNLLDVAKLEEGMLVLHPEPFDLKELLGKVERISTVRAGEKDLSLELHYAPHLPTRFIGDAQRLHQVLTNLVSNALKFTDKGGVTIDVGGEPEAGSGIRIFIRISDSGIGIPDHKIERMFHKFTQEDGSISRRYGGTGLGLAICRDFTALMGGHINVHSEVGKGSEFTLIVPLTPEDSADAAPALQPSLANALAAPRSRDGEEKDHRPRVLLVDDSNANILLAATLLEEFGYVYEVAWNGLEALERLERGAFSVMLADVQMPGLNGLELTHIIRLREKERKLPALPIIAMTAHAFAEDRERCLRAGMTDYLSKPFDHYELKTKLEKQAKALDGSLS